MTSEKYGNDNLFEQLILLQKKNEELQELNNTLFVEKVQLITTNQLLVEENRLLSAKECALRLQILDEKNWLRNRQFNN